MPWPTAPCCLRPMHGRWLLLALLARCCHAYTRRIKVQHLAPFVGRHNGGLLINVTGKGFVISTNPKCRFGAMEVVATVVESP